MELSEDKPSPGGGAAAAAAGAMGASLLVMVCGITRRKKKYEANWKQIAEIEAELAGLRDNLLSLAKQDAVSYDHVLEAVRARKAAESPEAAAKYADAVREATEVPRRTAAVSERVLELAVQVATFGTKSATSDTGVGVRLAEVGVRGAALNILINLKDNTDASYARTVGEELMARTERANSLMREALSALENP